MTHHYTSIGMAEIHNARSAKWWQERASIKAHIHWPVGMPNGAAILQDSLVVS